MTHDTTRPLPSFADRRGRVWEVRLTARSIRELQAVGTSFEKILGNGDDLAWYVIDATLDERVSLLWHVVQPAATADRVTLDEFEDSLDGPAVAAGVVAVLTAAAEFYPHTAYGRLTLDNPGGLLGGLDDIVRRQVAILHPHVRGLIDDALGQLGNEPRT